MLAPTQRFSSRVDNYLRYRPGYPIELIELLEVECGLTSQSVVADLGSGTGKFTEQLLPVGCRVFGVEPNLEMRAAGERLLAMQSGFISVAAGAEATTLLDASVDLIVSAQAFHWFDQTRCHAEFARILKPGGRVALIWNDRQTDTTPFLADYEKLLREFATDYEQVNHRNIDAAILHRFFGVTPKFKMFPYAQHFNYAGLEGRLLSSSYAPEPGHPNHAAMLARLRQIFDARQRDGKVIFEYNTQIYYGQLA